MILFYVWCALSLVFPTRAMESSIAGYRAALADLQRLTNRRTKEFVVLALEKLSGWDAVGRTPQVQTPGQRVGGFRLRTGTYQVNKYSRALPRPCIYIRPFPEAGRLAQAY
jgi:hypothetical protein